MDQLDGRESNTERGTFPVEQSSAKEPFHDGESDIPLLTDPVEFRAVRIDTRKALFIVPAEHRLQIFGRGPHIERGIDAEEDHLDEIRLRREFPDQGIMRAQADVPDRIS